MHSTQVVALLVVFASLAAAAPPLLAAKGYFAYPKYSYNYGVDDKYTGDHKTATESRDGDVVKGSYSLIQPDGVLRTVIYESSPLTGFVAKVINSGPAVHGVKAAPVVAKGIVGGYGGFGHGGYGHGVGVAVKPAAVAYTQAVGPVAFGGGYGHGFGGHGGHFGGGYGGFHGGY